MKLSLSRLCSAALLVAFLTTGCGSGTTNNVLTPYAPAAVEGALSPQDVALAQAMAQDPDVATQLAPTANLNAMIAARSATKTGTQAAATGALTISVADLQTNYQTLFCGLSDKLGVTITSPESVAKINYIRNQSGTGYFNLLNNPISNNAVGVTAVSFQPVTYQTTVPLPSGAQTFQVSGGLLMPLGISKAQIKGVVVYFHGTTFNKQMVGSNYSGNVETQLMAQVFASQGYIVAIPDYVGQGVDWQDVHPYVLYPQVSAKTAVDMLAAVKPLIVSQYGFTGAEPALKLFSTGYSEGGSYALWFSTFISRTPGVLDTFYALTHSMGCEGAYATSTVMKGFLFGDVQKSNGNIYNIQRQVLVNLVKPLLSADAFLSYATYSVNSSWAGVFNMSFFNLDCEFLMPQGACDVLDEQVDIAEAFAKENTTIAKPLLFGALGKHANGAIYPGLLEMLTSKSNSVNSLVSPILLTPTSQQQLDAALQAADANLSAVADQGASIITLSFDSVVVPNNFDSLLAAYPSKIRAAYRVNVDDLKVVSPFSVGVPMWVPVDHLHGLIYEFLYVLNTFNSF